MTSKQMTVGVDSSLPQAPVWVEGAMTQWELGRFSDWLVLATLDWRSGVVGTPLPISLE
jgi:hypothetical protein